MKKNRRKKTTGSHGTPPASEKAEEPRFMFMCDGVIYGIELGGMRGPVFARTQQAAEQYVARAKMDQGINLVIADIQAVPVDQPFQDLLAHAVLSGADCYFVVNPFDRGEARFAIVPLDSIHHEVDGWTVPLTDTELPKYTVTREGEIMMLDDGNNRGPVLAHTRDLADRRLAEIEKREGTKLSVEEIKIPVNALLDSLVEHGANCAFVIRSFADDGETKRSLIFPATPPVE